MDNDLKEFQKTETREVTNVTRNFENEPMMEVYIFETTQNLEQLEQVIICSEKNGGFSPDDVSEIFRFIFSRFATAATAVLYTLVESTRTNELEVYEYLNYLLTEIPNSDYLNRPKVLDRYLPWSSDLPDHCGLSHNYKKCLKFCKFLFADFWPLFGF